MLPRLVAFGERIIRLSFVFIDLIKSGINLSFDQSPPPITLPALPIAIFTPLFK